MDKKTEKLKIKEFYFKTKLGSYVVIAYFINVNKYMKLELTEDKEVTSIAIINGFDEAYSSPDMLKKMELTEAARFLDTGEDKWSDFVTDAILKFIDPISSVYCMDATADIFDQTKRLIAEKREDYQEEKE